MPVRCMDSYPHPCPPPNRGKGILSTFFRRPEQSEWPSSSLLRRSSSVFVAAQYVGLGAVTEHVACHRRVHHCEDFELAVGEELQDGADRGLTASTGCFTVGDHRRAARRLRSAASGGAMPARRSLPITAIVVEHEELAGAPAGCAPWSPPASPRCARRPCRAASAFRRSAPGSSRHRGALEL